MRQHRIARADELSDLLAGYEGQKEGGRETEMLLRHQSDSCLTTTTLFTVCLTADTALDLYQERTEKFRLAELDWNIKHFY